MSNENSVNRRDFLKNNIDRWQPDRVSGSAFARPAGKDGARPRARRERQDQCRRHRRRRTRLLRCQSVP